MGDPCGTGVVFCGVVFWGVVGPSVEIIDGSDVTVTEGVGRVVIDAALLSVVVVVVNGSSWTVADGASEGMEPGNSASIKGCSVVITDAVSDGRVLVDVVV